VPVSFLPRRCLCVATPSGLLHRVAQKITTFRINCRCARRRCHCVVGSRSVSADVRPTSLRATEGLRAALKGILVFTSFLLSTPLQWFFVICLTSLSIYSPVDSLNPKTWQAGINRKVNPTPSLPSSPLEPHRKRRNRQPVSVPSLWIFLSSYIAIGAAPSQFNGMTLEDIKTLMGAMKEPADMVLLLPSPTFPKCFMLPRPTEE